MEISYEVFWTDSKVVLGYIFNQSKRFHLFCKLNPNHSEISDIYQWRYVSSAEKPADDASCGQSVKKFVKNERWLLGPKFLWRSS